MLEGLLRLLWRLVLHVAVALGQVGVEPIHWHVNHLDLAIGGEDLLNMFLDNVFGEATQVDLSGSWAGASTTPIFVIFLHRLGLGA